MGLIGTRDMAQRRTSMLSAAMDHAARIAARFDLWRSSPCRLTAPDGKALDRMAVGALGERIAAAWLARSGCRVLYRNFRARGGGEVDVVMRDGEELVFVEVKTRSAGSPGRPMDAVDLKKQRLIRRGANAWLSRLGTRDLPWRFDVLEVIVEDGRRARVSWVKDAFSSERRDPKEKVRHPGDWVEV